MPADIFLLNILTGCLLNRAKKSDKALYILTNQTKMAMLV